MDDRIRYFKLFDKVWHKWLLDKRSSNGITGRVFPVIVFFLTASAPRPERLTQAPPAVYNFQVYINDLPKRILDPL